MKNKFSLFNIKFFAHLKQIINNEYPDSKSDTVKRKVSVENNLRWQDDGGPAVDTRPIDQAVNADSANSTDLQKNEIKY